MRDLGFDEVVSLELHRPRRCRAAADPRRRPARASRSASPTRSPRSSRRCARRCSARCSTPPRYNLARGAERVALFESGRVYLREGARRRRRSLAGEFVGERPAPAYEPHRIGGARGRRRCAGRLARRAGAGRTSTRSRACSRRSRAQLGVGARGRARRASRSCTPAARPRSCVDGEPTPAGSASSTRSSAAPGTSTAPRGFEIDLAPLVAASPVGEETYEDVTTYPGRPPGHRRGRRRGRPGRRGARRRARGRRRAAALGRGLRPLRGEQVGEGRKSLALRLEFRAADRTLTDEEVAGAARARSRPSWRRSEGRCVNELAPTARRRPAPGCWSPAPPASPGRWRRSSSGATRSLELVAGHRAQRRRHAARRALPALPGAARARPSSTSTELEDVDAAIVAYPHGAAAPVVAALRGLGHPGRRPLRRLPAARPADLRALVRAARRAGAARRAPSTGCTELHRERAARGRAGRQPRLLPDRERAGAGAARRARA